MYWWYTRSHVTYVIVYVPMNLSLQFCVPPVHKISSDLRYSLCPYELVVIILCTTFTQDLMRLYTCSSCHIRFLSTLVLIHLTCLSDSSLRKTIKVILRVMKPVGPYRNIKYDSLHSYELVITISPKKLITISSNFRTLQYA